MPQEQSINLSPCDKKVIGHPAAPVPAQPFPVDCTKYCGNTTDDATTGDGDPMIMCTLDETPVRILIHSRYDEEGLLLGYFNTSGDPVQEGVDFQVCQGSGNCTPVGSLGTINGWGQIE